MAGWVLGSCRSERWWESRWSGARHDLCCPKPSCALPASPRGRHCGGMALASQSVVMLPSCRPHCGAAKCAPGDGWALGWKARVCPVVPATGKLVCCGRVHGAWWKGMANGWVALAVPTPEQIGSNQNENRAQLLPAGLSVSRRHEGFSEMAGLLRLKPLWLSYGQYRSIS